MHKSKEYMIPHAPSYCFEAGMYEKCNDCPFTCIDIAVVAMIQECEAFYYVFKELEQRLFSGIVDRKDEVERPLLISVPLYVNGAFAVELALKTLLLEEDIGFDRRLGHQLIYLYKLLPIPIRKSLEEKISKTCDLVEGDIQKSLETISEIFNHERYRFETLGDNHCIPRFFKQFTHIVCDYVLTEHEHKYEYAE